MNDYNVDDWAPLALGVRCHLGHHHIGATLSERWFSGEPD